MKIEDIKLITALIRRISNCLSLLVLAIFIHTSDIRAEGEDRSGGFFPKDFAEAPNGVEYNDGEDKADHQQDSITQLSKQTSQQPSKNSLSDEPADDLAEELDEVDETNSRLFPESHRNKDNPKQGRANGKSTRQLKNSGDKNEDGSSEENIDDSNSPWGSDILSGDIPNDVKVALAAPKYLSAFIECSSMGSCASEKARVYQISTDLKLPIRHLYYVNILKNMADHSRGDDHDPNVGPPFEVDLDYMTRSSHLIEPPPQYKITRIPSWVVGTAQGEVLFDGIDNPAKFIKRSAQASP